MSEGEKGDQGKSVRWELMMNSAQASRWVGPVVGWVLGVVILVGMVVWVDPRQTLSLARQADMQYLLGTAVCYLMALGTRSSKMHVYINLFSPVHRADSLAYYAFGSLIANVTPARMGEPAVSLLTKRNHGIDILHLAPLLFADKVLDFGVVIGYAILSLAILTVSWPVMETVILLMALVVLLLSVAAILFRVAGPLDSSWWMRRASRALVGFKELSRKPVVAGEIVLLTLLGWLFEIAAMFFTMRAFGVSLDFVQVSTMVTLGIVTGLVSLLPGGIGSSEMSMAGVGLMFGARREPLVAGILVHRSLLLLVVAGLTLAFSGRLWAKHRQR